MPSPARASFFAAGRPPPRAIIIYQLLREPAGRHDALATADSGVDLATVPAPAVH